MFGTYFYNKRTRSCVALFGSLFNNIFVLRQNSTGEVISQVQVPLSYAPKRNFIERLAEMSKGEEGERRVAIKLPRMSFEIVNIAYDPQRQLPKVHNITTTVRTEDGGTKRKLFVGTPYSLSFQLNIYAKTQDDALQIVEQILPYFAPQYTVTVRPFEDQPDLIEDVPITLVGMDFQDDYEGPLEERRTIIYTMQFDMKINYYGPVDESSSIIREINTNINVIRGIDTSEFVHNINITPNPLDANPDDEYGFNVVFNDYEIEGN